MSTLGLAWPPRGAAAPIEPTFSSWLFIAEASQVGSLAACSGAVQGDALHMELMERNKHSVGP
jgi:hypothetical protein